ncbi:MAG: peptidyl-prolyl cis-trans isomerase A (cyclophilin A) [Myxococcota bacterium]|jgi:peptidyl-prolyl cis-trans isomerase A (cyclophilin A)
MRVLLLTVGLVLSGCGGEPAAPPEPAPKADPAPAPKPETAKPAPKVEPAAPDVLTLPEGADPALTDPSKATATAPAEFKVRFTTNEGDFVVHVHRDWAPNGADRFYNLVQMGFFTDVVFFRAVDDFMVQFGLSPYPEVSAVWRPARIKDDDTKQKNLRGRVTFATSGPNSRTTQMFINFKDNSFLDSRGFAPFGEIVDDGMTIVDKLHTGYGDSPPRGKGPNQGRIQMEGNAYLKRDFPDLDHIVKAVIEN